MKIILASDSHGHNDCLYELEKRHPDANYFIHCGDLCEDPEHFPNWLFVEGNNDFWGQFASKRIVKLDTWKAYVLHGDKLSLFRREENLADQAISHGCQLAFFGHTHCITKKKVKGVWLLNPGSLWMNRDGNVPSYMEVNLEPGQLSVQIHAY